MKAKFISQGIDATEGETSLGAAIWDSLGSGGFRSFLWVSAFASRGGVIRIKRLLEFVSGMPAKDKRIIVGVDQHGTSREALEELLSVEADVRIFYFPQSPIFHPKVYFFEGSNLARLIVGSSNLTVSGLFQNAEASLQIDLEKGVEEDDAFLVEFRAGFQALFADGTPNLQPLTQDLIALLVKLGVVPTEVEQSEANQKTSFPKENNDLSSADVSTFETLFPKTNVPKIPNWARKLDKVVDVGSKIQEPSEEEHQVPEVGALVWMKKNLPKSDVQISEGNTAPTGGLRLTQAYFNVNGNYIDQTTYFRHDLFGDFSWDQTKSNREEAIIPFGIIIHRENWGIHRLSVKHNPAGHAQQGNYTTLISWGVVSARIKESNLVGMTLRLYRSEDKDRFTIVIE